MAENHYKGKLRVRVSGILLREDMVLLAKLKSPARINPVWMPPGGGVEHGELLEKALEREFREETGLHVKTNRMAMIHEFIEPPYHALEIYFICSETGGELKIGKDPEHATDDQILMDMMFIPVNKLESIDLQPDLLRDLIPRLSDNRSNIGVIHAKTPDTAANDRNR